MKVETDVISRKDGEASLRDQCTNPIKSLIFPQRLAMTNKALY